MDSEQRQAEERLDHLALSGVGLWVTGFVVGAVAFSRSSLVGMLAGGLVLTVGCALLTVALVAHGVRLGLLLGIPNRSREKSER